MKFSTDTDVAAFVPEQQDALLAEMQAEALRGFQAAATLADRARAAVMFAEAARSRVALARPIELNHAMQDYRDAPDETTRIRLGRKFAALTA